MNDGELSIINPHNGIKWLTRKATSSISISIFFDWLSHVFLVLAVLDEKGNSYKFYFIILGNLQPSFILMFFYKRTVENFNKRNDKRFNNRGFSLSFLIGIFLKHL